MTKADIIRFLKDSFALGHKAAATLTTENMLQAPEHSKSPRLHLATFAVAHAYDHYGQMVEYLRMNGIVPPAAGESQTDWDTCHGWLVVAKAGREFSLSSTAKIARSSFACWLQSAPLLVAPTKKSP